MPRFDDDRINTAVVVESSCGSDDLSPWSSSKVSSGVGIGARHLLTANHVVECPEIPDVHVTLRDGRRLRAVVESSTNDVATLVLLSADDLGFSPPTFAEPTRNDWACVVASQPTLRIECGTITAGGLLYVESQDGFSGAPVYGSDGSLNGVTTGRWEYMNSGIVLTDTQRDGHWR